MQQENAPNVFRWPPLESDPAIFTEYLHKVGLAGDWQVGECFGLDEDCLSFIPAPCVAMIVNSERLMRDDIAVGDAANQAAFYMKQSDTLDNACGIIACLHAVFNNQGNGVNFGEDSLLGRYWAQVKDSTPEERCTALEGFDEFKEVHKTHAN